MAGTNQRARLIKLIHVGRRDLQLDEDVYRGILSAKSGGKQSASECSVRELEAVLAHLKVAGFKIRTSKPKGEPSRALAQDPESRKIRALWLFLHELGVVRNPSEDALAAYVRRVAGVDALQWISADQAGQLIETMKRWAMRYLPRALKDMVQEVNTTSLDDEQRRQIDRTLRTAFERMTFDPMRLAWEAMRDILKRGES